MTEDVLVQLCRDLELRHTPRHVRVLDERQEDTDLQSLVDDVVLYLHYCQVPAKQAADCC